MEHLGKNQVKYKLAFSKALGFYICICLPHTDLFNAYVKP